MTYTFDKATLQAFDAEGWALETIENKEERSAAAHALYRRFCAYVESAKTY